MNVHDEDWEKHDPSALIQSGLQLLNTDFFKLYDVYISSVKERADAAKMYVTLLITPFVLAVLSQAAQKIAGETNPVGPSHSFAFVSAIAQAPEIVRWLFVIVGLAGVVPLQRFVDAHCQVYKMSRSMNNFRLLYRLLLDRVLSDYGWALGLKVDPNFPSPVRIFHWTTLFAVLMALINCSFVWLGVATLDDSTHKAAAWVLAGVYGACQFYLYSRETKLFSIKWLPEHKRYRDEARSYTDLRKMCGEKALWKSE